MRTRLITALLCAAALAIAAEPTPDERLLTDHKIPTDGAGLVKFVGSLVLDETAEARIKKLVKQLGDDDFDAREQASRLLIAVGAPARPFLRKAEQEGDAEVVARAHACMQLIDQGMTSVVTSAAIRLLGERKPDGAAEIMLRYVPYAEDETVAEEVRQALAAVAVRDGKPERVVVEALGDKTAAKRAAAGAALARANPPDQREAVGKLLKDSEPMVRLRVGLALAAREKDALPVLIALLDNPKVAVQDLGDVEDVLNGLAADQSPLLPLSADETARKKYREAWEGWWKEHGAKVDVARLEEASKRHTRTLVTLLDKGIVMDLDAGNKPRWQIEALRLPLDVQVLRGDRVLIAEHDGGRVTERNRRGDVLWERKIDQPLVAQRLPNGNTFIATRSQLMELAPDNKVVFNHFPPGGEIIMRAQKLRNGDIVLVQTTGAINDTRLVRIDAKGKELKSMAVNIRTSGGRIDVLPNGNILIPENAANRVIEVDPDGKTVWEVAIDRPVIALRLPNGNTLATSMSETVGAVEFDRTGKQVWQYQADTRVTRAVRH